MELKSGTSGMKAERLRCSNRTFMELKWEITPPGTNDTAVLIAPLWN